MKKILCIGEALIDVICTDRGKSLEEGQHFIKKPGGAPTNVAAAIAALGGAVELAAKVGADPFGDFLIDTLKQFGAGTRYLSRDPTSFTTLAFVSLMENGDRDFHFNRGADGQLNTTDLASIEPGHFPIVHFGSATAFLPAPLQQTYTLLLQDCIAKKCFISFDPNYRSLLFKHDTKSFIDQSWHFLKSCHFFKVSDEEALLLTGTSTVEEAAEQLLVQTNAVFAITTGKKGAILGFKGKTFTVPGIPVNAIDTTGAGDAFAAAILYQLSKTEIPLQELDEKNWQAFFFHANKAGARTCEYMGAMEAFKHLSSGIFH